MLNESCAFKGTIKETHGHSIPAKWCLKFHWLTLCINSPMPLIYTHPWRENFDAVILANGEVESEMPCQTIRQISINCVPTVCQALETLQWAGEAESCPQRAYIHSSGETHNRHVNKPVGLLQVLKKCYEEDKVVLDSHWLQMLKVLFSKRVVGKRPFRGGDIGIET